MDKEATGFAAYQAHQARLKEQAIQNEWADWQEVVGALAGLGVTEARLNGHGQQFVEAVTRWARSKAILDNRR